MIKIYTEDEREGKELCKFIKKIYFDNIFNNIAKIESLKGIPNVTTKVKNILKESNDEDIIIIVFDNIISNPLVKQNIERLQNFIKDNKLYNRVKLIETNSFEAEILLVHGIECFCNIETYNKYFLKLRIEYDTNADIDKLTEITKQDNTYNEMYEAIRNKKRKNRYYADFDKDDFEKSITIESLSKRILSEVYQRTRIDKPLIGCWQHFCCYKKFSCASDKFDTDKINSLGELSKINFLILNTSYRYLIEEVYKINNKRLDLKEITIADFLNDTILESNFMQLLLGEKYR